MYSELEKIKRKFLESLEGTDDDFRTKRIFDFFNWLWIKLEECEDQENLKALRKYIVDVFVEIDRPCEEWYQMLDESSIYTTYFISNWGRVKSVRDGNEMILRPTINPSNNYLQYSYLGTTAHRLVAEHFIPNPENKPIVDHINTNKLLPKDTNLRWVTYQENYNNTETIDKHRRNNTGKPVIGTKISTGETILFKSISEASRELKIAYGQIINCCKGIRGYKTAGGYKWEYVPDQ